MSTTAAPLIASTASVGVATIRVETAPGELIDKLTILAIKLERIADPGKRANVLVEFVALEGTRLAAIPPSSDLDRLTADLRAANESLWDIEDQIRDCERRQDFGPSFVSLARAVYKTNDERAAVKRAINVLLGSRIVEEKSYHAY